MEEIERDAILLSIEEARKSKNEKGRISPMVGAVIVKDNKILGSAHRGELNVGEHAEYALLEKKFGSESLAGATIFTTLEPCTTRNHPKIPCVERLIERKVKKVWIGMHDPNPNISGRGFIRLHEVNIETEQYPEIYRNVLADLNRDFVRDQRKESSQKNFNEVDFKRFENRTLDDWYIGVNKIYWNRNYYQNVSQTFSHLVEVVGGLSSLVSGKEKANVKAELFMPKAIAWWLTLCGKLGINSVEEMIWDKFPNICPYCQLETHDNRICGAIKAEKLGPNWQELRKKGAKLPRPKTFGGWQKMFDRIYQPTSSNDFQAIFARLVEELGELSEAIRVYSAEPGYFLSEACDVFAWLMRLQNELDKKVIPDKLGYSLSFGMAKSYPDLCTDCQQPACTCPPILKSTIGRIAHEVPIAKDSQIRVERFLTADQMSEKFGNI